MFPIQNIQGHIIAFGGRTLEQKNPKNNETEVNIITSSQALNFCISKTIIPMTIPMIIINLIL